MRSSGRHSISCIHDGNHDMSVVAPGEECDDDI